MNSDRWIESKGAEPSEDATKFPPLPGGEGRGEGERKYDNAYAFRTNPSLAGTACNDFQASSADGLPKVYHSRYHESS